MSNRTWIVGFSPGRTNERDIRTDGLSERAVGIRVRPFGLAGSGGGGEEAAEAGRGPQGQAPDVPW
jgi:hypothetical protein